MNSCGILYLDYTLLTTIRIERSKKKQYLYRFLLDILHYLLLVLQCLLANINGYFPKAHLQLDCYHWRQHRWLKWSWRWHNRDWYLSNEMCLNQRNLLLNIAMLMWCNMVLLVVAGNIDLDPSKRLYQCWNVMNLRDSSRASKHLNSCGLLIRSRPEMIRNN